MTSQHPANCDCNGCLITLLREKLASADGERNEALRRCDEYENEIASVCAEDYSLQETFTAMSRQIDCLISQVLSMEADRGHLKEQLSAAKSALEAVGITEYEDVASGIAALALLRDDYLTQREQYRDEARELLRQRGSLQDKLAAMTADCDDLQATFDMRWKADMEAIKRWREAHPGNDLVWPDGVDLCMWLMDRLADETQGRSTLDHWLYHAIIPRLESLLKMTPCDATELAYELTDGLTVDADEAARGEK